MEGTFGSGGDGLISSSSKSPDYFPSFSSIDNPDGHSIGEKK